MREAGDIPVDFASPGEAHIMRSGGAPARLRRASRCSGVGNGGGAAAASGRGLPKLGEHSREIAWSCSASTTAR